MRTDFKCVNMVILVNNNFSFDCIIRFWNMNWNIDYSTNNNLLVRFICNWFVKFSINSDSSSSHCITSYGNRFIRKDCLVSFRNNFKWNVCILANLDNFYLSSIIFSFDWGWNFDVRSCIFHWNIYYISNDHWGDFFIRNWAEILSIDFNDNLIGWW